MGVRCDLRHHPTILLPLSQMNSSRELVAALKAELKRAGMTYAQLAPTLGLSESSVKRLFAQGDLSLARIDLILGVLKLDFTDLARQLVSNRPPRRMLTREQEAALVADPRVLTVALSVLSEWPFEQIVSTYRLSPAQVVAALTLLDRQGLIELRPNNLYRLNVDKTLRWQPDGPLMRFFRERVMADYFDGHFEGEGELLSVVHGQISPAHADAFVERLERLVRDFALQHSASSSDSSQARGAYTLVVGIRSWWFSELRALLREPTSADRGQPMARRGTGAG